MNAITKLALTLALPSLLLASNVPATRVRFAPAADSSLTKTFEAKSSMSLEKYIVKAAGQTQSPDMELSMTMHQKVVVSDTYGKLREGAPAKLERTFDELSMNMNMDMKIEIQGMSQDTSEPMNGKSELEGKKVVFTWDDEKGEYTKAFDPKTDDDALLTGLTEDMDLRVLLTDREVKEGDEWELPIKELASILSPGGSLSFEPEGTEKSAASMSPQLNSFSDLVGDKLEGKASAKFAGMRELEGKSYAVIAVTFDVKSAADMTESAKAALEGQEVPGVEEIELDSLDVEFAFEGEGELLWNVEANHFHTFQLSGTAQIKTEQALRAKVQGMSINVEETREMSGTSSYSASAK